MFRGCLHWPPRLFVHMSCSLGSLVLPFAIFHQHIQEPATLHAHFVSIFRTEFEGMRKLSLRWRYLVAKTNRFLPLHAFPLFSHLHVRLSFSVQSSVFTLQCSHFTAHIVMWHVATSVHIVLLVHSPTLPPSIVCTPYICSGARAKPHSGVSVML